MGSVPFHYIDLRAFAYETEDVERVERALRHFVPEEFEFERSETKGHNGDRILILSARVENADGMRAILNAIRDGADLETVRKQVRNRVTENCEFYVHFDKQEAYRGASRLGDGIVLRAKVEAYPAKREAAVENATKALTET